MTQRALGALSKVDPAHISRVEHEKADLNSRQLWRVAQALGTTVGALYGEVHHGPALPVRVSGSVAADGLVDSPPVLRLIAPGSESPSGDERRVFVAHPEVDASWWALEVATELPGAPMNVGDLIVCRPSNNAPEGAMVIVATDEGLNARLGHLRTIGKDRVVWPITAAAPLVQIGKAGWRVVAQAVELRRDLEQQE